MISPLNTSLKKPQLSAASNSDNLSSPREIDASFWIALQIDESRLQALVDRALCSVRIGDWPSACADLTNAIALRPDLQEFHALLVKVVSQTQPLWALQLVDVFLDRFPDSPSLWSLYWSLTQSQGQSQAQSQAQSQELLQTRRFGSQPQQVKAQESTKAPDAVGCPASERLPSDRLPYVTDGGELRVILKLLAHQALAPRFLGVCHYDAQTSMVSGWALDLSAPSTPCALVIRSSSERGQLSGRLLADAPSALLQAAEVCAQSGGFKIRLAKPLDALHLTFVDGTPLLGSPLAPLAPIAINTHAHGELKNVHSSDQECVDVLVPVYNSAAQTLVCLMSLLNAKPHNRTVYEIIVLDDASQDPALLASLDELSRSGRITWIQRPANLGFIRNINRGMMLHAGRDVVWLNSDTRVTGDWLDRLRSVAYSRPRVASVTPFSNNGELMSFPQIREVYPTPSLAAQKSFDDLLTELDLSAQEIVVGCGFCFYVKRIALDDVGLLDELTLIKGYGEETDWCLRAQSRGWSHAGATNVFVAHAGGLSFGASKRWLANHNNTVIKRRYPFASEAYERFVTKDSLHKVRQTIQRHRLRQFTGENLVVDAQADLSHELQASSQKLEDAREIKLVWSKVGVDLKVTLWVSSIDPAIVMHYLLPEEADCLVQDLASLGIKTYQLRAVKALDASRFTGSEPLLPKPLIACLDALNLSRLFPEDSAASVKRSNRRSKKLEYFPLNILESLGDSLGVIDDDLTDPLVATSWCAWLKKITSGSYVSRTKRPFGYLLALQDTPAVREMQRTGLVGLVCLPKGLHREQWLKLLGVSYRVRAVKRAVNSGSDGSDNLSDWEALDGSSFVCLPCMSAKSWLQAMKVVVVSSKSPSKKVAVPARPKAKNNPKSRATPKSVATSKSRSKAKNVSDSLSERIAQLGFEYI